MAPRPVYGLSLCAGGGGLDLGLEIAIPGFRALAYVEREAYAASVLVARMAEAALCEAPIWDDIATFDGKPWRGLVDIVSAGDPCQPWSHAGQRKGYADERVVFDDVARIVDEVQPEFVFLENVAGAIDFRWDCKAVLEGMGYRVEAGLFSAAEVGAPHGRTRIFLLAHADGYGFGSISSGGLPNGIGAAFRDDTDGRGSEGLPIENWMPWGELPGNCEPIICRVAERPRLWRERLRLNGESVVPLTAALAFRTLWGRLMNESRQ